MANASPQSPLGGRTLPLDYDADSTSPSIDPAFITPTTRSHMRLSDTEYSRKSRMLISLVNDLTALGANQFVPDIPCIAFIGNQSSGKSSIVERATGIAVPRDSGTCTKCPMQCTMQRADGPWSCQITLRYSYNSKGRDRTPPLMVPFHTVYDPAEVEIWLRRAQAAILSGSNVDPKSFYEMTREEINRLKTDLFSFNTIEILVRDPEGTDLSFVDLPGIIQYHTDKSVIPLVKKLVGMHITRKNTLIVVAIPMPEDEENHEAFGFALKADPTGSRTIGVGTKPDMITPGSLSKIRFWTKILEGKPSNLIHGYYGVKMPDDKERAEALTRAEIEKREEDFFEGVEPWSEIRNRERLGMKNFVESTSRILIGMIEKNLPKIKKTVHELLDNEKASLAELPAPITTVSPLFFILTKINVFCKVLRGSMLETLDKPFIHANQERYRQFNRAIEGTRPLFDAYDGSLRTDGKHTISKCEVTKAIKENLTWELPGYVPFDATKYFIVRHISLWDVPLRGCFEDTSNSTLQLLNRLIADQEHFGRFSGLRAFVKSIVEKEKNECQAEVCAMLERMFNLEVNPPLYTANSALYEAERGKWLERVCGNRMPRCDEDRVMADVHAYFQVSSSRFVDQVVKCIEGEWHQGLVQRIDAALLRTTSALSPEQQEVMLQEDPIVRAKRETISTRIDQLERIKARLEEYEREAGVGAVGEEWSDEDAREGSSSGDPGDSDDETGPPSVPSTPRPSEIYEALPVAMSPLSAKKKKKGRSATTF